MVLVFSYEKNVLFFPIFLMKKSSLFLTLFDADFFLDFILTITLIYGKIISRSLHIFTN